MSFADTIHGLKEAISADPSLAGAGFQAWNELVGTTEVAVRMGEHGLIVDEPVALGGTARGPNPVELALAALGSCQAITYRVWAALQGVEVDTVRVRVKGDLDLRGFFGVDAGVRPGFGGVQVFVEVSGPESAARYEELQREVDRYCPVLDIFQAPVPVKTTLQVTPKVVEPLPS